MRQILRSIGAVLLGFVVASVIMVVVETVNSIIFAFPAGLNPADANAMNQYIATLPAAAYVVVLIGWALGTFAGTFVAARVSGRSHMVHGMILAVLLLLAGIANMLAFPHPIWMWVGGIIVFVAFGYAGSRVGSRRATVT